MCDSVYLGLGANIDNRLWYIVQALRQIEKSPYISIRKCSSIYETEPYGIKRQRDFLNAVVQIETSFRPAKLLECLKFIERKLGRKTRAVWRSREIDIDILAYGDVSIALNWLTIPHQDLHNRLFVLDPFSEIAPDFYLPGHDKTVTSLRENCDDKGHVSLVIPSESFHFNVDTSFEEVSA